MTFKKRLGLICLVFTFLPLIFVSLGNILALKESSEKIYVEMLVKCAAMQDHYTEKNYERIIQQTKLMGYSNKKYTPSFVQAYQTENPDLKLCGVTNSKGVLLLASDDASISKTILSDEQLKLIGQKGGPITSYSSAGDGFLVAVPLSKGVGTQQAFWVNIYKPETLEKMMNDTYSLYDSYSFLVHSNGDIIGYPNAAIRNIEDLKSDQESYHYLQGILQDSHGGENTQTLEGNSAYYYKENIKKITIHTHMPYGDWILVTTMNSQHSDVYVETLLKQLAVIITLLLILIYMLLRQSLVCVFRPVTGLLKTIQAIEKGEDSARFLYEGKDELGLIAIAFNQLIEKQLSALSQLRENENRYRVILEQANEIIWEWQSGSRQLYLSDNWQRKCCKTLNPKQITVDAIFEIIHPEDREKCLKQLGCLSESHPSCQFEMRILENDHDYLWMLIRATVLTTQNHTPARIVGVAIDIDETRKREKKLLKLATYDHLTKVYNRSTFEKKSQNAFRLAQYRKEALAIIFIDVDNFKQINDKHGHDMGDVVLETLGRVLQNQVGENGLVGRFGGDEFVVCMISQKIIEELDLWLKDLEQLLDEYVFFTRSQESIRMGCSIGKASYPQDGLNYEELLHHADTHMYHNKDLRKGRDL